METFTFWVNLKENPIISEDSINKTQFLFYCISFDMRQHSLKKLQGIRLWLITQQISHINQTWDSLSKTLSRLHLIQVESCIDT